MMDYIHHTGDGDIFHTPFGSTIKPPSFINPDVATITYRDSAGITHRHDYHIPNLHLSPQPYFASDVMIRDIMKDVEKIEEDENTVKIDVKHFSDGEIAVFCGAPFDLLPDRVLTTLSALKGRLMLEIEPIQAMTGISADKFRCSMTPEVKKNILSASKRLKMYGKKPPIIARFDEYGNPLPEEIHIGSNGVVITILDDTSNWSYLELRAHTHVSRYDPNEWGDTISYKDKTSPYFRMTD